MTVPVYTDFLPPTVTADWLNKVSNAAIVGVNEFNPDLTGATSSVSAIQSAVDKLRALIVFATRGVNAVLYFPPGIYLIDSSVDMTNIRSTNQWNVEARGAVFLLQTPGKAAFDLLGSRFCVWNGGILYGDPTTRRPLMGIQIGRMSGGLVANDHSFLNVTANGQFERCVFYNYASEGTRMDHCHLVNVYSGADTHDGIATARTVILDGNNQDYLPVSDFVAVGAAAAKSFLQNRISRCSFEKSNAGSPLYVARINQHDIDAYLVAANAPAVVCAFDDDVSEGAETRRFSDCTFRLHCELDDAATPLTSIFHIKGSANCFFNGLKLSEVRNRALPYVFTTDAGVATVQMSGTELDIASFRSNAPSAETLMFDTPSKFQISGEVYLGTNDAAWNAPAIFKGALYVDNAATPTYGAGAYFVFDRQTNNVAKFVGTINLPQAKYTKNTTVGATAAAAGDLTGAKYVSAEYSAVGANALTTRTATQMFGDTPNAQVGDAYTLVITNTSGGTTTLTAPGGGGVTLTGTMSMLTNTTRTFIVTYVSATTMTFQSIGVGTIS